VSGFCKCRVEMWAGASLLEGWGAQQWALLPTQVHTVVTCSIQQLQVVQADQTCCVCLTARKQ
jgi:hypothetical protein